MEYGHSDDSEERKVEACPPPPPPDPQPLGIVVGEDTAHEKSDEPLLLTSDFWDINTISSVAALRMLITALQSLAEATGDVPPTPPVRRPTTPRKPSSPYNENSDTVGRTASSPNGGEQIDSKGNLYPAISIGPPEAHPQEPIALEVGDDMPDIAFQQAAIARKFFSKTAPPFTLQEYLLRFHHWCPHSPGVYLAAAAYIHRLCVSDLIVPATNRTVHRLSLAAIRIASKAIEDNKWPQERVANVGGISSAQLRSIEVALCYLLDFELGVPAEKMARSMFLLQQAGQQRSGVRGRLGSGFKMQIPARFRNRPNSAWV